MIYEINLYYDKGTSDKVYNIYVEETNKGYRAYSTWGRRGLRLNTSEIFLGEKHLALLEAEKKANEKIKKGYQVKATRTPKTPSRVILVPEIEI
jgi:predicted DNA-binding WGR domain protein